MLKIFRFGVFQFCGWWPLPYIFVWTNEWFMFLIFMALTNNENFLIYSITFLQCMYHTSWVTSQLQSSPSGIGWVRLMHIDDGHVTDHVISSSVAWCSHMAWCHSNVHRLHHRRICHCRFLCILTVYILWIKTYTHVQILAYYVFSSTLCMYMYTVALDLWLF